MVQGKLDTVGFTWGTLICCLFLQRFAFPAGGALKISLATPLVLGLGAWGVACGSLSIDRRRAALYLGLCAVAIFSVGVEMNIPLAIAPRMSITSLAYWLAITGFAVLRFRDPMPERAFFGIAATCFAVLAAAGILQFLAQFAGVSIFEFTGIVPSQFLIEEQYALVIPMDFGLNRSNGFFLVEPSVFSQFMALGIVIEALYFRRPVRMALLFVGLLVSFSGTGWLVLGAAIAAIGVGAGMSGLLGAIALLVGCGLAFAGLSLALPDTAEMMLSRMSEFTLPGTSGHERFVTPFMALQSVWDAASWTIVTGVGPGASEQLSVPYFYRLNTPIKILLEYGAFGLGFYLLLLVRGTRTSGQRIVLVPALVLLLLTGGYHQFSPILFAVLLLASVAVLRPDSAPTASIVRRL
jgi:hypothetical protein